VGDASHCTFFEMLGNWSLGDYFKKDAITWSWEFLTHKDWLNLPTDKLYFTVFEGDADAPRDMESYNYWRALGVEESHIYFLPKKYNWWGPAGMTGPCGPDTEMFIDTGKAACSANCSPACSCGKYVEFWNNVFMEYNKTAEGKYIPLAQKNVDTGMGLERILMTLNGGNVYEMDVFTDIMRKIEELARRKPDDEEVLKAFRIIADHIRCATFILGDDKGMTPSNVDQGYVLRRLIRRAIRYCIKLEIAEGAIVEIAGVVIRTYAEAYPELTHNRDKILNELALEEQRFLRTLNQGIKEFEKLFKTMDKTTNMINGENAFHLYDTYGFPIELTVEVAKERGFDVDVEGFKLFFEKHQELSKAGASQKFKGGLADHTDETTKLHTATHMLHTALRRVLGDEVKQKGSNITTERLRFDFSFSRKMTPEEVQKVQEIVNDAIRQNLEVKCDEMSFDDAIAQGAIGLFESKYGSMVKVYSVGNFSKEVCGGPHVQNTSEMGSFKIQKEESSSAGVRRIKAILEKSVI